MLWDKITAHTFIVRKGECEEGKSNLSSERHLEIRQAKSEGKSLTDWGNSVDKAWHRKDNLY